MIYENFKLEGDKNTQKNTQKKHIFPQDTENIQQIFL